MKTCLRCVYAEHPEQNFTSIKITGLSHVLRNPKIRVDGYCKISGLPISYTKEERGEPEIRLIPFYIIEAKNPNCKKFKRL